MKKNDLDKKEWQINNKNHYYGFTIQCKGSLISFHPKRGFKVFLKNGQL